MSSGVCLVMKRMEGIWRGEGLGEFPPRIAPFQYLEELTIRPMAKPNTWELRSQTRNKVTDKPMHVEVGFIRAQPNAPTAQNVQSSRLDSGKIEFVLSHPFGLSELSEGNYFGNTIEVTCRNDGLNRVKTATAPFVTETRRVYDLKQEEDGDFSLNFLFEMGTSITPMQSHLVAKLKKVT
jgi:hypothetical protein